MVRDFLVSCMAAAHQEGFFSMALIKLSMKVLITELEVAARKGEGCGKISGSPWPANGQKGHRSR